MFVLSLVVTLTSCASRVIYKVYTPPKPHCHEIVGKYQRWIRETPPRLPIPSHEDLLNILECIEKLESVYE